MFSADDLDSYNIVVKTMPFFWSTKIIQIKLLPKLILINDLKNKLLFLYSPTL